MRPSRSAPLILIIPIFAGCATYRQELASLPIRTSERTAAPARMAKRIAVLPFDDQRGVEWSRESPERYIPVVHWFHRAKQTFYPEQLAILRRWRHGRKVTTAGSFAGAMPALLETTMRQMGVTDRVTIGESSDGSDYVVVGRIKQTAFRTDLVPIAAALSLLGVPWGVSRYHLEYEVALYDARDRTSPIFSRTYDWSGKRTLGAYYNGEWAFALFVAGLEHTLPRVVSDVEDAIAARG
jgi:hypothetical protein